MGDIRLGSRIRAFRKLKGFTQQQLASEMGVSLSFVGTLERGTKPPTELVLRKIANTLQVEYEELCAINKGNEK
ncbi:helix-turn-helix transcriptional regulator [Brevibacillus sp. 7WMA2]|uniref:Anaerobic benzoate catabolism transcriptional regulator n=3 Tax=Brevibacillus TaxID=55080 RepID=A0A075QVQ1_BRELA|nr:MULTISPECIES: helix-turn-helix transcriptional regulator [Brevibacillus]AIG24547.1 anaerobic benzoate catabolism transcriptional regulator [Brevibacillus laterosporus LMG 15441]AKF93578.1 transcriptional regulator [Brevibacillus laterosporus]AUM63194.1 XRE family transcriptional regulator [Brevibacillus laterosporus]AYK06219.1 XRE family transcriptional regulator [Brevibacillus laterosporus]MBA4534251.1 helix-turn-helix transcriptional regulator [Brevibacillus halotolerans]